MFQEKDIYIENESHDESHVSVLSQRLQDLLNQPNNPFVQYAKFDGEVNNHLFIGV